MSSLLQHSPADILGQLLIDNGQASDPTGTGAWPLSIGLEADIPDNVLTVYDTVGQNDGREMVTGELLSHEGIQLRVRAADKRTGYAKANALRAFLSETVKRNTVNLDGVSYTVNCAVKIGQVLPIGDDVPNTRRKLFTLNFLLSCKEN